VILLQWLVFGPSGRNHRPDGLVIESYTRRLPQTTDASCHLKTLVRTEHLLGIDYTPHAAECSGPACTTRGENVLPYAIQPIQCRDVMVINHCFTNSLEDWAFRRCRGRGDSLEPYQERVFSDVASEAEIEDTRATRFVPRLRALLGT
jgi:hypothetical protein